MSSARRRISHLAGQLECHSTAKPAAHDHFEVVIIGAGFSGLLCATYLRDAGIENVRLFEMSPAAGGVWSEKGVGSYPGAACDVQAYTYLPMLDRTGFVPSKKYVSQPEISGYAELLAEHNCIANKMKFDRKVTHVAIVGENSDRVWQVTTVDSRTGEVADVVTCKHVVSASGPLSSPRVPEISGIDNFKGESFHTAKWDASAQLKGKRVGVVGTGASAAQVITSIVDDVDALYVFQRTATWCLPRDDEPTPDDLRKQFESGGHGEKLREVIWKEDEVDGAQSTEGAFNFDMLHDPEQNKAICNRLRAKIQEQVTDPEIAAKLTPDYPFFCKRALFIDDYYTTFNREHVTLVADAGGVTGVTPRGLQVLVVTVAGGEEYELDVIVYATGFDTGYMQFEVTGRGGEDLATKFGARAENKFQMTRPQSLWGIHAHNFPNFYMMIGPQSLNPVTNVTLLCEEQSKYISDLVKNMQDAKQTTVEPTPAAVDAWTELCNGSSDGKVWLQCNNWYMKTTKDDASKGRERSAGMWMESYPMYLQHLLGGKGGIREQLLAFT